MSTASPKGNILLKKRKQRGLLVLQEPGASAALEKVGNYKASGHWLWPWSRLRFVLKSLVLLNDLGQGISVLWFTNTSSEQESVRELLRGSRGGANGMASYTADLTRPPHGSGWTRVWSGQSPPSSSLDEKGTQRTSFRGTRPRPWGLRCPHGWHKNPHKL